jgi:hypothetical protein
MMFELEFHRAHEDAQQGVWHGPYSSEDRATGDGN